MSGLLIVWLACGIAAGVVAGGKGRSGIGWTLLGAIFGPIALLAAAAISPDRAARADRETRVGLQDGSLRPCPVCAEPIKREALKCRYCASDVPAGRKPGFFG